MIVDSKTNLARAQSKASELVKQATALPPAPERYIENIKFGLRGVIFHDLILAPSDPSVMYLSSYDGFVYVSRDGGITWSESRIVTKRSPFFGAIRPSLAPNGAPFSLFSPLARSANNRPVNLSLAGMFNLPYGTTGKPYLEFTPDSPAFWKGIELPSVSSSMINVGRANIYDRAGSGGGGGDLARLGVGNTASAPMLQRLLRKRKARVVGMNLKLLLAMRGREPTWVNYIAVHPKDPNTALLGTAMGVYKTKDGGLGWEHVFPGRNARERWCDFIQYAPGSDKRVFLGTRQGLLISEDGGGKFARPTGTQLSTAPTNWIEFYSKDPNIIYAGTNIGVFRSKDGGKNWRWIFYETLKNANFITSIVIDPNDPDRLTISTWDGLFRTSNGGKLWERSGGFLFTAIPTVRSAGDPKDGDHIIALTSRFVWESFDWGETWQALYINDSEWSPRSIFFDPVNPEVLWVLTSGEILKLSSKPPQSPNPRKLQSLLKRIHSEPDLPQVMDSALRAYGVHRGELSHKRSLARLRYFMPELNAVAGHLFADANAVLNATYLSQISSTTGNSKLEGNQYAASDYTRNNNFDDRYENGRNMFFNRNANFGFSYWGVYLNWDLTNLVFEREEAPFGRYFGHNNWLYLKIKFELQRLFEERRRVILKMISDTDLSQRNLIMLRMRLLELTATLNAHTDGLYDETLNALEKQSIYDAHAD